MIQTILHIGPESFLSATILCRLKPSTPNNIVSFYFFTKNFICNFFSTKVLNDVMIFFACLAPKNPNNFDVYFWFLENQTWHSRNRNFIKIENNHLKNKSNLTTNIFMLVNLEPFSGFILEIKSIPNYLQGHTVAAMRFNMGHLVK